jgi:thioredoxin-related protein
LITTEPTGLPVGAQKQQELTQINNSRYFTLYIRFIFAKKFTMKRIILIGLTIISFSFVASTGIAQQSAPAPSDKIKWVDIEEAQALNKKKPKKIFVDMYTDWCGWCKKMDASTFINPVIVKYMNDNYYAVKFNAERKDTVTFNGKNYINSNPSGSRASHQLAQELLGGRMSYPSFVFLDENLAKVTTVPGFRKAPEFEAILNYINSNAYKTQKWEEYNATFERTAVE